MDARSKNYVVMSAVSKIHGKRGKTSLVKLLRGSHEYSVEKMVQEFDLLSLWGILYKLDREEIEGIISSLMENEYIYSQDVQSGGYNYPMLHISEEGRELLKSLEFTEPAKLRADSEEQWEGRMALEISDRGILLNEFLTDIAAFLQNWSDGAYQGMELDDLIKVMELDYSRKERLEKFIYRATPEKVRDSFRGRYTLDITCYHLMRQVRELLGALSELEAMIFRYHYNLQDSMYKPIDDVLKYYGMMQKDIQTIVKKIISRFSNRTYLERFSVMELIMSCIDEFTGSGEDVETPLIKETTTVTYDLYKDGMPIPEIARERGLAVSTIYSHFTKLIPQYKLKMEDIISKDRVSAILHAINSTDGISLKAIKQHLTSDFNYGEIKLVLELQKGWNAA